MNLDILNDSVKPGRVHNISEEPGNEDKAYTFSVRNSVLVERFVVNIVGVDRDMIIESRASCNITGMPLCNSLKGTLIE